LGVRPILNGVAQPYEWQSHNAVKRRIENYAKGLQKLGLGRQESLGVYGVNRPEWVSVFYYDLHNELSDMTDDGRLFSIDYD
jgi:long-subunit acyl-CoA synthetase (AMP-forming)